MSAAKPVAVGLGEVLWDLLPGGKQLGGAPANFAWHAQQLGAASAIVSAVGKDPLGFEIVERLADVGLDTDFIAIDDSHPTGTVSVTLDALGVPSYVIHENVAWDFIPRDSRLDDLAKRADVVCFGSLARRTAVSRVRIRDFLLATRPAALRVCDINLRQNYFDEFVLSESIHLASVLKLNEHELPLVMKTCGFPQEGDAAVKVLLDHTPIRLIALTRGDKGSVLYTRDQRSEHPGFPTEIVDTVGAGDAFTAALAMGMLRGDPLDRTNDHANRVASYVCSQAGAMPHIPAELAKAS